MQSQCRLAIAGHGRPAATLELGRLLRREALTGVCALIIVAEAAEAKQREEEITGRECRGAEDETLWRTTTQNSGAVIFLGCFEDGGFAVCRGGLLKQVALLGMDGC